MTDLNVLWMLALTALAVVLFGIVVYYYRDNRKLRETIRNIQADRDELAEKLDASEARQAAILSVLKFVMEGEIQTARNDERAQIFAQALAQINTIQRSITINNHSGDGGVTVSGGAVETGKDIAGGNHS